MTSAAPAPPSRPPAGAAPAAPGKIWFGLRSRFTGYLTVITLVIMAGIAVVVSREVRMTLEQQITQRGLALARNLADSCTDFMSLEDRTLSLMLLAKEYVQSGGGEEARRRLFERRSFSEQVQDYVLRLGAEPGSADVRNEGVLAVRVVDPAGTILAYADATTPAEEWFAQLAQPYVPEAETGLLAPGEAFRLWRSPARNGIYLLAVPILGAAAGPAGPAGAAAEPGAGAGAPPSSGQAAGPPGALAAAPGARAHLGAVYLAMSQRLVERTVARAVAILILIAAGLVAAGAVVAVAIASVLTRPIRLLTDGVRAIAGGEFGTRIPLARRDELGDLADAFNDMAKGLAEREVMRGAFSTYVSGDLLAEIMKNPDAMKLGGSRREATVMFTFFGNHHELPGLMARLDPEAIVRVINDYLELQARLVKEHKGHLDKFVGEEVMAVWGATVPLPDHPQWAVRCAVAIENEVRRLNERRARDGQMTTEISIGINTGSVVAGNMGSQDGKRDYTVISSDVNFAARLAGAGAQIHGGEIWLGEATFERVKDLVLLKEKRMVSFKGIPDPQPVYVLAGLKEAAAAAR